MAVSDVSDVAEVEEYSYGPKHEHLTESQALDHYRVVLKSKSPDTLVVLQDHDCGHWTVMEFKTPQEREGYLRSTLNRYLSQVLALFSPK